MTWLSLILLPLSTWRRIKFLRYIMITVQKNILPKKKQR
ncbi:GlyGly-CTERM sorting domain-containing protein [Ruminococcus sp. OM05-10BH]|nr:GlyGly-CTERM sorting domain-containing protein [Ruminococcus sp. OM05-10BH]